MSVQHDDTDDVIPLIIAQGVEIHEEPEDHGWPLAQIWVPNPEYASGWESVRIDRKKPVKKNGKRPLGFKGE